MGGNGQGPTRVKLLGAISLGDGYCDVFGIDGCLVLFDINKTVFKYPRILMKDEVTLLDRTEHRFAIGSGDISLSILCDPARDTKLALSNIQFSVLVIPRERNIAFEMRMVGLEGLEHIRMDADDKFPVYCSENISMGDFDHGDIVVTSEFLSRLDIPDDLWPGSILTADPDRDACVPVPRSLSACVARDMVRNYVGEDVYGRILRYNDWVSAVRDTLSP